MLSGGLPHAGRRVLAKEGTLSDGVCLVMAAGRREDCGTLRKGSIMWVAQLIAGKTPITISGESTIQDLVVALAQHRLGALIVSSDGRQIEGIVSERDVVRAMPENFTKLSELRVRDLMTVKVVVATVDSTIDELMTIMTERRVRHIPIVDADGMLLSIVSIGDIVKSRIKELDEERQSLIGYISQ